MAEGYLVPFTSDFSINWLISCNSVSVNVTSPPEQFSRVRSARLGSIQLVEWIIHSGGNGAIRRSGKRDNVRAE